MTWQELLVTTLNQMSVILTACIGIIGMLVGSLTTFFVQSRLQERDRKNSLDDQRRQWKREKLLSLRESISENIPRFLHIYALSPDSDNSKVIRDEIVNSLFDIGKSIDIVDDEMKSLFLKFAEIAYKLSNEEISQEEKDDLYAAVIAVQTNILNHIDTLIEDTFK